MKRPLSALRSPRKALLGLLVVLGAHACNQTPSTARGDAPAGKRITFEAPTPAPVEIFWIDSAGNLGLRGVVAVVPGAPATETDPKAGKLPAACRASAATNGDGTLTVCMDPTVGKALAKELGLEWTSPTSSEKP